jgi:penicillin-binding protein-related factor A (putative recombinase)
VKESDIQKSILDYLKLKKYLVFKHRNVGIFKQDTGRYIPLAAGEKGISDILGCTHQGKFLAIEVKMPKKKPSPEQLEFLDKVNLRGGIGFVAYSLDDVIKNGL